MNETEKIKAAVKKSYAFLATSRTIPLEQNCCETSQVPNSDKLPKYGYSQEEFLNRGYSQEELKGLPESVTVMADGCGNPTGLGAIREGETVLDLGSGGGIDVFLASKKVGPHGKVIGLDMTPEMVERANDNARKMNLTNVEFRLGEIEHIPLADASIDVIMSNCVICLIPDKGSVFREMFRALRRGGRLAIADEIAIRPFSQEEKIDPDRWCSCLTGAISETEYSSTLKQVGFVGVYVKQLRPASNPDVFSAFVSATKP